MVKGEDYPLKTCIMEWGIWVFYEVWQRMFWCGYWSFSSSFLLILGFLAFAGAKDCFLAGKVPFDITASPPFIVICCDPWSSWFWPGHPLNSWIMGLFVSPYNEVKLTMFLDKTKILPQTKLVKEVDSMIKVSLHMFSLRYLRFAGHLCSCPPTGMIHLCSRLPYL